jgi:hypothetical protein
LQQRTISVILLLRHVQCRFHCRDESLISRCPTHLNSVLSSELAIR